MALQQICAKVVGSFTADVDRVTAGLGGAFVQFYTCAKWVDCKHKLKRPSFCVQDRCADLLHVFLAHVSCFIFLDNISQCL